MELYIAISQGRLSEAAIAIKGQCADALVVNENQVTEVDPLSVHSTLLPVAPEAGKVRTTPSRGIVTEFE